MPGRSDLILAHGLTYPSRHQNPAWRTHRPVQRVMFNPRPSCHIYSSVSWHDAASPWRSRAMRSAKHANPVVLGHPASNKLSCVSDLMIYKLRKVSKKSALPRCCRRKLGQRIGEAASRSLCRLKPVKNSRAHPQTPCIAGRIKRKRKRRPIFGAESLGIDECPAWLSAMLQGSSPGNLGQ